MEINLSPQWNYEPPKRARRSRFLMALIGLLILLTAILAVYFYLSLTPMRDAKAETVGLVEDKTKIVNIDRFQVSNRRATYYSVFGTDSGGDHLITIVKKGSKKVKLIPRGDAMSDKRLTQLITEKYQPKKIYSAVPAIYKKKPVWEVSYLGKNKSLNYATLDFQTGSEIRIIKGL